MASHRILAEGLQFPEGPVACSDGSVLLVEIQRRTITRVSDEGGVSVVAELDGGPNGAAVGPDGCLYICINGGFHNLSTMQAAAIAKTLRPRVVVPCHYDMMVNNVGSPEMLRVALDQAGCDADCFIMKYYEPWLYRRH